jgi:4-aminobutyrate aminotransferase-like enzyme
MAAGLEVLSILEEEQLAEHARKMGDALQSSLRSLAQKHPVIRDIRGQGLLIGIEFEPVAGLKAAVVPRWARPQLFAQVIAAVLLRDHGLLTQACGLAPSVLRVEPPLIVSLADIQSFLHALDAVLAAYPSPGAAIMAAIRKTVLKGNL